MRKSLHKLVSLVLIFSFLFTVPVYGATEINAGEEKLAYFYNQLTTNEAKGIYKTLETMLTDGSLKTGKTSVDLVETGVLENRAYDKNVLMADFISARDAFMFDNNVFYVDFDKLSITQTQIGTDEFEVLMGIGREKTYFGDGFDADNVEQAIKDFDTKVAELAAEAAKEDTLKEQVKAAYEGVMNSVSYALEADAKPENVLYVRDPYGALVRGEAVCEGYARALKAVLDEMGIDNVLVQGAYDDADDFNGNKITAEPHMWNYVKMDDNRWYQLDATMGDGNADSDVFFLNTGLVEEGKDSVIDSYMPNGVISLSSLSVEFNYPDLSAVEYAEMGTAFTADTSGYTTYVSYKGMGLSAAQATGKYILASHDGTIWYYYDNLVQVNLRAMGYENEDGSLMTLKDVGMDEDTRFADSFVGAAYLAVTDIAPNRTFDENDPREYYIFSAGIENLYDVSKIGEAVEYSKNPPSIVTKIPYNSILKAEQTYQIEVEYSEDLIKANSAAPTGVEWTKKVEGAVISDFEWHGDRAENPDPRTVTFKLKTVKSYANTNHYYFDLVNLIGKDSKAVPNKIHFSTVNNPVFGCPKISTSLSTVYSSVPALIADSNLAENDWKDANGNSIGEDLPARLALVSTPIEGDEADKYEDKIEGNVLGSKTFDLSLSLCGNQVSFINGKPLKVFVPFPEGFDAQSNVTFKAYHYDRKTDRVEEIDCVTTEHGIIMMCNAFSPFTVAAVEKTAGVEADKNVMLNTFGNGGIYKNISDTETMGDLVKVSNGETESVVVKADKGYKIERITLNGNEIEVTNNGKMTVEFEYSKLNDNGNTLEAEFTVLADGETLDPSDPDEGGEPEQPGDGGDVNPPEQPGDGEIGDDESEEPEQPGEEPEQPGEEPSEPEKEPETDNNTENNKPTTPETGDETNIVLWISVMAVACAGLLAVLLRRKAKA